jgi:hypothetical protein
MEHQDIAELNWKRPLSWQCRIKRRLHRRHAPTLAPLFAGRAAVGPGYRRPTAIVPAQYKEIKGWKISAPNDDFGTGEIAQLMRQLFARDQLLSTAALCRALIRIANQFEGHRNM